MESKRPFVHILTACIFLGGLAHMHFKLTAGLFFSAGQTGNRKHYPGKDFSGEDRIVVISAYYLGNKSKDLEVEMKNERTQEILEALQRNLNNHIVSELFIVSNSYSLFDYLTRHLRNTAKLRIYKTDGIPTFRTLFKYATETHSNKMVLIANADTYLGKGFDKINKTILAEKRILYSLTRNGRQERRCKMPNICFEKYEGSHDAYFFVPTFNISLANLQLMDIKLHEYGAENVLIWILGNKLKFKVLNPCRTVRLYHNHCSGYRPQDRPRINRMTTGKWAYMNGLAPYTGLYD